MNKLVSVPSGLQQSPETPPQSVPIPSLKKAIAYVNEQPSLSTEMLFKTLLVYYKPNQGRFATPRDPQFLPEAIKKGASSQGPVTAETQTRIASAICSGQFGNPIQPDVALAIADKLDTFTNPDAQVVLANAISDERFGDTQAVLTALAQRLHAFTNPDAQVVLAKAISDERFGDTQAVLTALAQSLNVFQKNVKAQVVLAKALAISSLRDDVAYFLARHNGTVLAIFLEKIPEKALEILSIRDSSGNRHPYPLAIVLARLNGTALDRILKKIPDDEAQAILNIGDVSGRTVADHRNLYRQRAGSKSREEIREETLRMRQLEEIIGESQGFPKELYLSGIRGSAMLGYHELQPLANLIGRPIVVVRQENGDKVEIITYPDGQQQTTDNAVFVQNIGNIHFKAFTPASGAVAITGGTLLPGTAEEGEYESWNANDCLIASIRKNGVSFDKMSNSQVRNYCADYQARNGADLYYLPDMDDSGEVPLFSDESQIPKGFKGFVIIKPSDACYAQGKYNEGRIGEWSFLTSRGRFDVTYDSQSHEPAKIVQTGEYNNLGKLELLREPITFPVNEESLNLIKLS